MKKESGIKNLEFGVQYVAGVLLLTYLLMILGRWLHPATFSSHAALAVLIVGVTLTIIVIGHDS
jgi:hypothetical protein